MSCVSGIQLSEVSLSLNPAACIAPSAFARMFACVSTTPLGSLVDPEENCMNAVSSGRTRAGAPARETSSSCSIRNVRAASADQVVESPASDANAASRSESLAVV